MTLLRMKQRGAAVTGCRLLHIDGDDFPCRMGTDKTEKRNYYDEHMGNHY